MTTSIPSSLDAVAGTLLRTFGTTVAERGQPVWLKRAADGDEWLEVRGDDGLFGRRVAGRFGAVAVVATGRLRQLDEAHEPPAEMRPGFAGPIAMACVVERRDATGWCLRLPDGHHVHTPPEGGLVLETLRRAVRLSTAPPTESPLRVHVSAWVHAVSVQAEATGEPLDWDGVLGCYPLLDPTDDEDAYPEWFIEVLTRTYDWDEIRRRVIGGTVHGTDLTATEARWMDVGMFARWVLAETAPLDLLLAEIGRWATPFATRRFRRLVHGLADRMEAA